MAEWLDQLFADLTDGLGLDRVLPFSSDGIRKLRVVDDYIPTSTVFLFYDFAFEGNLPSGGKTTLTMLEEDEVPLFSKPYAQWAPEPFNRESSSPRERILAGYSGNGPNSVTVDRRISCMRARLWQGRVPMSGNRWKEKKLDDPKNWQYAFEFLFDIIHTFMWLGDPDITKGIKENFNLVARELSTLQAALNTRRAQKGLDTTINLTALWLEWVQSVFITMVTRTHTWMVERVSEIVTKGKAAYDLKVSSDGAVPSRDAAKKFLESWADLSRLLTKADWMLMMPMDGFTGFTSSFASTKVVGTMFPMPFRQDEWEQLSADASWPVHERIEKDIQGVYTNPDDVNELVKESIEMHGVLRKQIRGEPVALGREHWISIIRSRMEWSLSHGGPQDQTWGFVCYNLTNAPKEQWVSFLTKLHADFRRNGEWIEGFDDIRSEMGLQWIDGSKTGLAKNDIEAAKRHFTGFRFTTNCRRRVWKYDFLVVDDECFQSYMQPNVPFQEREPYGDHGGFVKLIDTEPYAKNVIDKVAPGYSNQLKVLGSLIFEDVYPLVAGLAQRPKDIWPYAMLHPNQVYVGPTVRKQEDSWDKIWALRQFGLRNFWKWKSDNERQQRTT